jgi:hypothetical protein
MKTLFEKVEIKSEQDLPKETGGYFVFHSTFGVQGEWFNNDINSRVKWLECYDWYLRPVESSEVPIMEDLKQYITNLLYYAFSFNGPTKITAEFDKWAEEQINNIDEYLKTNQK